MSTLTVALASLGGVVLAAVIAHGAWQARRAGPKRASDVREEPRAGATVVTRLDGPRRSSRSKSDDPADAALDESMDGGLAAPSRRRPRWTLQIDALIDAIATIGVEAPVAAEAVLPHVPATRFVGSKLVLVEGLDTETALWEAPTPGRRYGELQAGVQLASRTGALNEIEYSEFVQRVQAIAEAVGGIADVPDMLDVMARARELDAFASEHDAQLAIQLHARAAAWSAGYVQQTARRHGFVPGVVAGRLVYPSAEEGAPPVLTLSFDAQAALAEEPDRAVVRAVTLAFDVPQTDPAGDPFKTWQAAAQALAADVDAAVVDDAGQPLSPDGFASIGADLVRLYETLAAHDLGAGSEAARRLFS